MQIFTFPKPKLSQKPMPLAKLKKANLQRPHKSQGIKCPDLIALVTFGDTATVVCDFVGAFDPKFVSSVLKLPGYVKGCTNLNAGVLRAVHLLKNAPDGLYRKIYLLSDGGENIGAEKTMQTVAFAKKNRINIVTIPFGKFHDDIKKMQAIADATHNGKMMAAHDAEQLAKVFKNTVPRSKGFSRGEASVFVIDVSASMSESMDGKTRIEVVVQALIGLIKYKQAVWS